MIIDPADEGAAGMGEGSTAPARRRLRGANEVRERRRRYITFSLSVGLCVLLVNAIVGENGYLAALRLRAQQAELERAVAALRHENQRLQVEGRRLRTDPAALEETARATLGFIRPGETLIVLRDAVPPPPAPSAK